MSKTTNIFLTGVTGYIGGSVLLRLLEHPDVATFKFTALVRSQEKVEKLQALGVNAVRGSLQDLALLENLASEADIVISLADSDDVPAIKAILAGSRNYHAKKGSAPVLIQTSGTGVLADDAAGYDLPETQTYDDLNADQIETLPATQQHRPVDLELVNADRQGYVNTYIVLPSMIYGVPRGLLVEQGIQNPYAILIPSLVRGSVDRGRAGMVGPGQNFWPNVHVDDVADLYLILFNKIRQSPESVAHGRQGYYFVENGKHNFIQVGKAIGEAMVLLGKSTDPEPSTFTDEEIDKYFDGSKLWGSNSRCHANRSRSIGWKPIYTTLDMLASVLPDVKRLSSA